MCDQAAMQAKFEELVAANTWPALHGTRECRGCRADEQYIFAAMNAFCLAAGERGEDKV